MTAEPRTSLLVRLATGVMVILATLAIELAMAAPGSPPASVLGSAGAVLIAPMILAAWWLGRRNSGARWRLILARLGRSAEFVALLVLLILPLVTQPVIAAWTGQGLPLEIILMASLRNLGLGLGALAYRPGMTRLAALVSLFLVMIASAMNDGLVVLVLVGMDAVAGVLWLMLSYWEGLALSVVGGRRSHPPAFALLVWAGVFALVVIAAVAVGPTRSATVLAEWVASSGGTGENEPDARSGVNDGDNEVSASEDPRSIGFTESEVYLESDRPSLYDSFSDQYGEPIKPKNKQERMVAMQPQENQPQEQPTENLQAGRTFATARQRPTRPAGRGAERRATALIYVKGATPLHLGLTTYDHFDGVSWAEEPLCGQHCPLELVPKEGAWLRLDRPTTSPFAGSSSHQIKIGTLASSTLPIPANTTRLRVGSVNRPDFFRWAQAGLIQMAARTVPAGTVIDTESRIPNPAHLGFEPPVRSANGQYLSLPDSLAPEVATLVRSWAGRTPRGWSQVEAVVAGVRRHCLHDRMGTVPADGGDVVGRFLLGSRCGPDHLFASAAAVSLRLLGYPCRVVSGYYAAPDHYDPKTRHTPVTSADVHFWVEVLVPGGTWAAVEPTPGYELIQPALSLGERVGAALGRAGRLIRANVVPIAEGLLIGTLAVVCRRRLLDCGSTLSWWLLARGSVRDRAIRTLRLMELRSSWAGLRRPAGRTPTRWYREIAADAPVESRHDLERLLAIAGWARHAPGVATHPRPWSEPEINLTCRRAVRSWTLTRFRSRRRSFLAQETQP